MEYASRAVGNAGLTTGIIGTALGAMASAGGVAGLLGLNPPRGPQDPGDKPVTRYEMGLIQQINERDNEITLLKAAQYSDNKDDGLQAQINQQAVWTAGATATMGFMNQQIQALYGITKLMIPESAIAIPILAGTSSNTNATATTPTTANNG